MPARIEEQRLILAARRSARRAPSSRSLDAVEHRRERQQQPMDGADPGNRRGSWPCPWAPGGGLSARRRSLSSLTRHGPVSRVRVAAASGSRASADRDLSGLRLVEPANTASYCITRRFPGCQCKKRHLSPNSSVQAFSRRLYDTGKGVRSSWAKSETLSSSTQPAERSERRFDAAVRSRLASARAR